MEQYIPVSLCGRVVWTNPYRGVVSRGPSGLYRSGWSRLLGFFPDEGPLASTTVRHLANSPENMSLNPSPHDLSLPWNALLGFGLEGPLYGETFDLFYLIGGVLRSR